MPSPVLPDAKPYTAAYVQYIDARKRLRALKRERMAAQRAAVRDPKARARGFALGDAETALERECAAAYEAYLAAGGKPIGRPPTRWMRGPDGSGPA